MNVRRTDRAESRFVVDLWFAAKKRAYPYLPLVQAATLEDASTFFHEKIVPRCDIWVAEDQGELLGFVALQGSYIDRLYVLPARQRCGIGTALIRHAMSLCPGGLELHTHQKNAVARTFYEKHGFVPVRFGISPPPENEPDVEYHWRPHSAP
jgi:GNAT superfamily N-acetyltransferase